MNKRIIVTIFTVLLATLANTMVWSEGTREVRLGEYLLLRVRCAAGGFSVDERVNTLQLRANELLRDGKQYATFTVKKSGNDANIYADDSLFMTVGPCDAVANGTTSEKLANIWAQRLRDIFPRSTPDKPGVGRADQPGATGNAN